MAAHRFFIRKLRISPLHTGNLIAVICGFFISFLGGFMTFYCIRSGFPAGLGAPAAIGLPCWAFGACTGRKHTALSLVLGVLFGLLSCGAGMYLAYAFLIWEDNLSYGCTLPEALALVPDVLQDPVNLGIWVSDLLSGLLFSVITLFIILWSRKNHLSEDSSR